MINASLKHLGLSTSAVLFVLLNLSVASEAEAGRMKDIQLLHLEAIATHLFGQPDIDGLNTRNTAFEKAEPGYFTAISSEVLVYSAIRKDFEWVKCTTMIDRTEVSPSSSVALSVASSVPAGTPKYDYSVAKTDCQ